VLLVPPPDYKEVIDPASPTAFSDVITLTIPKPRPRYTAKVEALRSIGILYLTLRAAPLGEDRGYRVCWLEAPAPICIEPAHGRTGSRCTRSRA
jgi:hypothetical protein